jgi:hypothetical protein
MIRQQQIALGLGVCKPESTLGEAVTGRRQIDEPSSCADERCNPVNEDKVAKMTVQLRLGEICSAMNDLYAPILRLLHVEGAGYRLRRGRGPRLNPVTSPWRRSWSLKLEFGYRG